MTKSKNKKPKVFFSGDILAKTNFLPFGRGNRKVMTITVKTIEWWGIDYVINRLYHVMPDTVIKVTEEEAIAIQAEYDSIEISEYNDTENDPCVRLETGTAKHIVPESHLKDLVYSYRHKYNNPAYEVYKCPKCGELHMGKNINVSKFVLV